jgi:hypothetical protein
VAVPLGPVPNDGSHYSTVMTGYNSRSAMTNRVNHPVVSLPLLQISPESASVARQLNYRQASAV